MSNLSFMEKLLDGVEVEWKTLGEVAEIKRGTSITKKNVTPGEIPVIAGGRTPAYFHNVSNRTGQTIVIAGSGAYAGFLSWWEQPIFVSDAFTVKPQGEALTKYCYYWLQGKQQQLHEMQSGGGVPHVYPRNVAPLKIPIPCPENPKKSLEIQAEIVRILDTFTELTTELTTELNARKKQYNYYRDQLLSFEEGEVEWKTLGSVVNIKNGKDWKKLGTGNIPVYGSGGVMLYVDTFAYDKPTVLIPRKGSITNIFYVESPFWNVDTIYYTEIDTDQIIPKFLYYFMKTLDLMQLDTGSGRPSLTQAILNKIKVPIPMLAEQARIVSILDKFDTLTNSISEGLPREIELGQKQYEYYRDLLLSFPKPDSEVVA
jgi:type I restriction enzyme S subunit